MLILIAIIFFLLVFAGLVLVISDTIRGKGRFGINLKHPDCSGCGNKLPPVRAPISVKQAMWGGWICEACGLEMDKWGKPVNTNKLPNAEQKQIETAREIFIEPLDVRGKTPVERIFEDEDKQA